MKHLFKTKGLLECILRTKKLKEEFADAKRKDNGYSCLIAIKCDFSLINSDAMGHWGVIKCNKVANVISLCIQIKYNVICRFGACSVSNAAEPFVTV